MKPHNLATTAQSLSRLRHKEGYGECVGGGGGGGGVGVGINCEDLHRAFGAKSCRLCNPEVGQAMLLGRMQYTGDRRCTHYLDVQSVRRAI